MDRTDIINHFIEKNNFLNYLEIGVFDGNCIRKIIAPHKDGVDPGTEGFIVPEVNYPLSSDNFFELIKNHPEIKYDLIFIDGLHYSEQVKKDINNSLNHLVDGGIIVLHDCNPPTLGHSIVPRKQVEWNGDVYKAFLDFRGKNIHTSFVIDADWGCGVIIKDGKENTNIQKEIKKGIESWEYFDKNRKQLLNLISVNEFETTY